MHEALGWLVDYYDEVDLWIGLESDDGAELYLICMPAREEDVVKRLTIYEDQFDHIVDETEQTAVGS